LCNQHVQPLFLMPLPAKAWRADPLAHAFAGATTCDQRQRWLRRRRLVLECGLGAVAADVSAAHRPTKKKPLTTSIVRG